MHNPGRRLARMHNPGRRPARWTVPGRAKLTVLAGREPLLAEQPADPGATRALLADQS